MELSVLLGEIDTTFNAPSASERRLAELLLKAARAAPSELHPEAERTMCRTFAAIAKNPTWVAVPVAAGKAFDSLVRIPKSLAAYRNGTPLGEIEEEFGVSGSLLRRSARTRRGLQLEPKRGRPREVDHAKIRLGFLGGATTKQLAQTHGCSGRTIQRVLAKPVVSYQPHLDDLACANPGEALRGAWNRYIDRLAEYGSTITELDEPEWPSALERRALAAAAIAYRIHEQGLDPPAWLDSGDLVATEVTAPIPEHIPITWPLTPAVVARFNVAVDEASFESV